jgi:hypothetical protein
MRSTSHRSLVELEPEEPAAAPAGVAHVIEMWPLTRLRPYPRNARVHSPEQIAQIARSIEQWGFTIPVLVDESGMIIAGHGRVEAAKLLGMLEVPVIVARGWSDAQKRAYVIADNRLNETSSWDNELLRLELGEIGGMDGGFDLTLLGFSESELVNLTLGEGEAKDDAERPELSPVESELFNVAWLAVAEEWHRWLKNALETKDFGPIITPAVLRVHFLRARTRGAAIPQYQTLAWTGHRISTIAGHKGSLIDLFPLIDADRNVIERLRWTMTDLPSLPKLLGMALPMLTIRMAQDFPSDLAQTLIDEFCPPGGSVLDPCHGWGGRMLGFLLSNAFYYQGFDTDPATCDGVRGMFADLAPIAAHEKQAELFNEPFEDAAVAENAYDMVLTSPPYYDVEKYGGELSSHRRYATFDLWLDGFYRPLIMKAGAALKEGGIFALQVGNQTYPLEDHATATCGAAGLTFVEKRHTGMINNRTGTAPDDGEIVLIMRKGAPGAVPDLRRFGRPL